MTRPSDAHFDRVTQRSWSAIRCLGHAVRDGVVDPILIGGWACCAHSSPVPSADADVFLRKRDRKPLQDYLSRTCQITVDDVLDPTVETLLLDEPFQLFPLTEGELSRPHSFLPAALLRADALETRTVDVPGEALRFRVPSPPALGFLKLAALWGRGRAWQATTDRVLRARLDPAHQAKVADHPETYWRAKAGKDVFDLHHILSLTSASRILAIADRFRLRPLLQPALQATPRPLLLFAHDLAERAGARVNLPPL